MNNQETVSKPLTFALSVLQQGQKKSEVKYFNNTSAKGAIFQFASFLCSLQKNPKNLLVSASLSQINEEGSPLLCTDKTVHLKKIIKLIGDNDKTIDTCIKKILGE